MVLRIEELSAKLSRERTSQPKAHSNVWQREGARGKRGDNWAPENSSFTFRKAQFFAQFFLHLNKNHSNTLIGSVFSSFSCSSTLYIKQIDLTSVYSHPCALVSAMVRVRTTLFAGITQRSSFAYAAANACFCVYRHNHISLG